MKKTLIRLLKILIWLVILFPILNMLLFSFTHESHLANLFRRIEYIEIDNIYRELLHLKLSNANFISIFLNTMFWEQFLNSLIYTVSIVAVQLIVSISMGFVFAKVHFRFNKVIFFLYILVMATPYTVYLVPYNIIFHAVGIQNSIWCVVLPYMFFPFGAFFFRQSILRLDDALIEAALLDGANYITIILKIITPLIMPSLLAFILINITETWNLLEPFLAFVQLEQKHSLSVVLHDLAMSRPEALFAPSIIYMIPPVLVYFVFEIFNHPNKQKE